MSQNIIALPTTGTVSGLAEQTYINNALDTLNTKWSGSSAPSGAGITLETGQDWLNSSVSTALVLNIYDGAQWLSRGVIDTTNHVWTPPVGGGVIPTIASAATTSLGGVPQSRKYISGTTTITSFGTAAPVGSWHSVKATGNFQITASSAIVTLSGSNMTVASGDEMIWTYDASAVWKCTYWSGSASVSSIANNRIMANVSGSTASPSATTLSSVLDIGGATNGTVPYRSGGTWASTSISNILDGGVGSTVGGLAARGASTWGQVTPVNAGYVLTDNGVGNPPSFQASSAAGFGGAATTSSSTTIVLTSSSSRAQNVSMTAAGLSVQLPDATTLGTLGVNIFTVINSGAYAFKVTDNSGQPRLNLLPGQAGIFNCTNQSSAKGVWIAGATTMGDFETPAVTGSLPKLVTLATSVNGVTYMTYIPISSTTFLAVWGDLATTTTCKAMVVTFSDETLTTGSITTIFTGSGMSAVSGCGLTSSTVLVTWCNTSTTQAMVLSISGTSITTNTAVTIKTGITHGMLYPFFLNSTSVFVAGMGSGGQFGGVVLSISSTTITANTWVQSGTGASVSYGVSICQLSTTSFVYIASDGSQFHGQVITISGTTVSFGTNNSGITNSGTCNSISLVAISSNAVFMIATTSTASGSTFQSGYLSAIFSISGSSISLLGQPNVYVGQGVYAAATNNHIIIGLISQAPNYAIVYMNYNGPNVALPIKFDANNSSYTIGNPAFLPTQGASPSTLPIAPGRYMGGSPNVWQGAPGGYNTGVYFYNGTVPINAVY